MATDYPAESQQPAKITTFSPNCRHDSGLISKIEFFLGGCSGLLSEVTIMKKIVLRSASQRSQFKTLNLSRFAKDEDGTFTIFVLFIFLSLLVLTGGGTDMMKVERERTNLQSTLDRAVLAAADLDQKLPPKTVVENYLAKSGFSENPPHVEIYETFGSRKVVATAETEVPLHFLPLAGIDSFTAKAASTAEEAIGAVEVSLVLDISGSMGRSSADPDKTKIEVLRESAKKFVSLMLNKTGTSTETTGGTVSISIVPYATQVNAGAAILDQFTNVSNEHSYSHCINFAGTDFTEASLDKTDPFLRSAHFDVFTTSADPIALPQCPTRPGSSITAVTDDVTTLHQQIDKLTANGNTSIEIGVKWGAALLDPSFRSVVTQLNADGHVPNKFKFRPSNYNPDLVAEGESTGDTTIPVADTSGTSGDSTETVGVETDVLKIIVVMTDGYNTAQYTLDPDLRSGMSDVWYNDAVDEYWVFDPATDEYVHRPDPDVYSYERADHPFGDAEGEEGTPVRLTYPELFNKTSLSWNAYKNYGWQSNNGWNWYDSRYSWVNSSTKDTRTKNICKEAKDKGVIIYGIAFEAPRHGLKTIKRCASSPSHVYNVKGLKLEDAFQSIASSIRKLRLTQ